MGRGYCRILFGSGGAIVRLHGVSRRVGGLDWLGPESMIGFIRLSIYCVGSCHGEWFICELAFSILWILLKMSTFEF